MASLTGRGGSVQCHFSSAITWWEIHQPLSVGSRPSPSMLPANKSIRLAALCVLASVLHTNVDSVWSQSGCNSSKIPFGWDLSENYSWFSCLKPSFDRCPTERQDPPPPAPLRHQQRVYLGEGSKHVFGGTKTVMRTVWSWFLFIIFLGISGRVRVRHSIKCRGWGVGRGR